MHGFLRRAGKNGKSKGLRRKRFYKLHGAIFSKHLNEASEPAWDVNVQGAEVLQLGRTHFVLVLKGGEDEKTLSVAYEFEENTLILYAKTEDECKSWVAALRYAANRNFENDYEVGPLIGEGGFAQVRIGRCRKSGTLCAIKTMTKTEDNAKLFGREVAIIKRVTHPNIVKTYDVYETRSKIHIVMEYMEGGMLYDAIEDGVCFKEQDVAQFMREIIDGILYLHNQHIAHRDIKPENVLCTSKKPPFHVKISDFGLSSICGSSQMLMSTVIGTPEFIAPEIANRQPYTEKVDMWALGMLCYNAIARRLPFDEDTDMVSQLRRGLHLTFSEKEWTKYSAESRSFVRALLCYNAEKRLTPLGCLVHPWLEKQRPDMSSKIAAHGRISQYIIEQESLVTMRGQLTMPESEDLEGGVEERAEAKQRWIVGVIAVRAVRRLVSILYKDPVGKHALAMGVTTGKCGGAGTWMEDSISDMQNEGSARVKGCNDFELACEESDIEEEGSVKSWGTGWAGPSSLTWKGKAGSKGGKAAGTLKATKGEGSRGEATRGNSGELRQSYDQDAKPRYSGRKWKAPIQMPEDDGFGAGLYPRKGSLRHKLKVALGGENGNRLAPVRKLSRRLMGRGGLGSDEKGKGSVGGQALDLDLGFEALGLVDVDDSDVIGVEDCGPSSLFGKKHRMLMKKMVGSASPVTPRSAERGNISLLSMRTMALDKGGRGEHM